MYYDDQPLRFNVLSGIVCGAVLGAGLALLLSPSGPGLKGRALRRRAAELGSRTAELGGRAVREAGTRARRGLAAAREAARSRAAGPGLDGRSGEGVRERRVPRGATFPGGGPVLGGRH